MVLANSCAAWLGGQSQSLYKHLDTSQVVITSIYPDVGVEDFVREALGEAISRYGQPRVPIHRVEVKAIDSK